jgi:ABC-type glycerol-3-phosphate transport system permease component
MPRSFFNGRPKEIGEKAWIDEIVAMGIPATVTMVVPFIMVQCDFLHGVLAGSVEGEGT